MHSANDVAHERRVWGLPTTVYAGIQALLLSGILVFHSLGVAFATLASLIGAAVFTSGVLRRRPRPPVAWWLIVTSGWTLSASGVAYVAVYGLAGDVTFRLPVPLFLSVMTSLTYPLLAVGLTLLSRSTVRRGVADVMDALMTALAFSLLLWIFVLHTELESDPALTVVVVGLLLIFSAAVRLVMGDGLRHPVLRLLVLGVAGLVAALVSVLFSAVQTSSMHLGTDVDVLWALFCAILGVAGLHPALTDPMPLAVTGSGDLRPHRMVLFAILALVPPTVWAIEELGEFSPHSHGSLVAALVPVVGSAVFLLLLVARLGLTAGVAQIQARELAGRSAALARAVSEQDELQKQLTYGALHDPLTGLANRVVLAERMEWVLTRRGGSGRHALLLTDMDEFKNTNDTWGHPVGDELLIEVAHRLIGVVPSEATLARLGGDEFAVLVEDVTPWQARELADTIWLELGRTYAISGRELFLTTSVGMVIIDAHTAPLSLSDVLRDADLALYAAKAAGRNRVTVFHPDLRTARLDHARIATGLRQALARDEFRLYYQPIIDLETHTVIAVEALLRWLPADAAPVSPTEFIPIAEDTGFILPIGAWVLQQACRDARRWYDEHHVAVSVNVSARQLDNAALADMVIDAMAAAGAQGAALIIEITESAFVPPSRINMLHTHLIRLRQHGVRIAIDDFGTGYSTLYRLSHLPLDIVKIDRSFTQAPYGSDHAGQDWAFLRAILQLVKSLRMLAVAEGVETLEQAEALRALRCPLVQGYYFSRPVPAAIIDQNLALSESSKAVDASLARLRADAANPPFTR